MELPNLNPGVAMPLLQKAMQAGSGGSAAAGGGGAEDEDPSGGGDGPTVEEVD